MTAARSLHPGHDAAPEPPGSLPPAIAAGFTEAIAAACAHVGATAPNPPVGCAILDADGALLVSAGHPRAGQPHAEALALRRLRESGLAARAATLVVTLEPCNHQGRTGPCTEAILASGIPAVWIGSPDPNPHVAGHGAGRLRAAGLAVHRLDRLPGAEAAALSRDCLALIAPFRRWAETGLPWITVKQAIDATAPAATAMVPPPGARTFTGPGSLRLAHRLRRATDAIVTGTGTILADAPELTVRHLPDHPDRHRVLAVVGRPERLPAAYAEAATARGFTLLRIDRLDRLLPALGEAGVLWAMVEAGPGLLRSLREAGLWDDWLTITRQGATSGDRLDVALAPGRTLSPLSLLPELRSLFPDQEAACSRAS